MNRRCGSSKPTPAPLNVLAMKSGKTRRKLIEGIAGTNKANHRQKPSAYRQRGGSGETKKGAMTRQTTVKAPPANGQRGGGARRGKAIEGERSRYGKGNQRQNPPAGRRRGRGRNEKTKTNTKWKGGTAHSPARGGSA